jgi:glycosyltransferase involved in cell wall biosynthesis
MLAVICPVFNEDLNLPLVAKEWIKVLEQEVKEDFQLIFINDGSTDSTPQVLDQLQKEFPQIKVLHIPNGGHGQACLYGYRYAESELKAEWIFQIDSDFFTYFGAKEQTHLLSSESVFPEKMEF